MQATIYEFTHEIIIDEQFRSLLPALDKDTYARLEENLLLNGCRDALVIWKGEGILIDGHNRYEICMKHDIPFNTVEKEFATREDVLIWIISTQVARRNLSPIQLSYFRGLHYHTEKKRNGAINQYTRESAVVQNEPQQNSTATRLAKQYRVSRATVKRDAKLAESLDAIGEASPAAKQRILAGEAGIPKNALEQFTSRPREEIAEIATRIEEGVFEHKEGVFERDEVAPERVEVAPEPAATSERPESPEEPKLFEDQESPTQTTDESHFDTVFDAIASLNTTIRLYADGLLSELQERIWCDDTVERKSTLRTLIDSLEDLYTKM